MYSSLATARAAICGSTAGPTTVFQLVGTELTMWSASVYKTEISSDMFPSSIYYPSGSAAAALFMKTCKPTSYTCAVGKMLLCRCPTDAVLCKFAPQSVAMLLLTVLRTVVGLAALA